MNSEAEVLLNENNNDMVKIKTGQEFRESGLLWFINSILHTFGWAIAWNPDTDELLATRVKFRGFDEKTSTAGYQKVSQYLKDNIDEILKESLE